jgi:hypothetical protein
MNNSKRKNRILFEREMAEMIHQCVKEELTPEIFEMATNNKRYLLIDNNKLNSSVQRTTVFRGIIFNWL